MSSYLVTGASRGIGLEYVRQLSSDYDKKVFALVRRKQTSIQLLALSAERNNIHVLEADITDHEALKEAARLTEEETGGLLDVLINNAAFVDRNQQVPLDKYPTPDLLQADLRYNFDVNVIGVVFTINAFLPLLKKGKMKKVITISSSLGDTKFVRESKWIGFSPYSISKAGVNMVNVKYALEYEGQGFTFLSLSPGLVDTTSPHTTEAQKKEYENMSTLFRNVYPAFERPFTPEESVKLQLKVIEKATPEISGDFVSQYGNQPRM